MAFRWRRAATAGAAALLCASTAAAHDNLITLALPSHRGDDGGGVGSAGGSSRGAAVRSCPAGESYTVRVGRGLMDDSALNLTEVAWCGPECRGVFLGSPAVVNLPDGAILSGSDLFGAAQEGDAKLVFASEDNGVTWAYRSNVSRMYWANFFVVGQSVYLMGTAGDDIPKVSPPNKVPLKGGPVVIARSDDSGHTWTPATTVLQGSFQTAPTPVVEANGTLFRSMEDSSVGVGAFMMWASSTSDLLSPSSWARSTAINVPANPVGGRSSWQEGSAVVGPDGAVYNVLRVNGQSKGFYNAAGLTRLDLERKELVFVRFINGPFGTSKFVVRRHEATGRYYALSTDVTPEAVAAGQIGARNHLVLSTSEDLVTWRTCATVLEDDTGLDANSSRKYTGFEYPDWIFDGDGMIAAIRTSYRGAVSGGSSNRLTVKRVDNFAAACTAAAPAAGGQADAGARPAADL